MQPWLHWFMAAFSIAIAFEHSKSPLLLYSKINQIVRGIDSNPWQRTLKVLAIHGSHQLQKVWQCTYYLSLWKSFSCLGLTQLNNNNLPQFHATPNIIHGQLLFCTWCLAVFPPNQPGYLHQLNTPVSLHFRSLEDLTIKGRGWRMTQLDQGSKKIQVLKVFTMQAVNTTRGWEP